MKIFLFMIISAVSVYSEDADLLNKSFSSSVLSGDLKFYEDLKEKNFPLNEENKKNFSRISAETCFEKGYKEDIYVWKTSPVYLNCLKSLKGVWSISEPKNRKLMTSVFVSFLTHPGHPEYDEFFKDRNLMQTYKEHREELRKSEFENDSESFISGMFDFFLDKAEILENLFAGNEVYFKSAEENPLNEKMQEIIDSYCNSPKYFNECLKSLHGGMLNERDELRKSFYSASVNMILSGRFYQERKIPEWFTERINSIEEKNKLNILHLNSLKKVLRKRTHY